MVRLLKATFVPVNGPIVSEAMLKVPSFVLFALFIMTADVAVTLLELGFAGNGTAIVVAVPDEVTVPEFKAIVAVGNTLP